MSRLVVVLPLAPLQQGERFEVAEWPLHITVLPPFLTQAKPEHITSVLEGIASACGPIVGVADEDALFGRRHNIPVTVMAPNAALTQLHRALIEALRPFGAEPDEPAFTGNSFRAHVTVKGERRIHPGDTVHLTQLALVDMVPRHEGGRTVLAVFPLGDPERTELS